MGSETLVEDYNEYLNLRYHDKGSFDVEAFTW